jgi:hypothetical protein
MIGFDPAVLARTNIRLSERARKASIISVSTALLARTRRSTSLGVAAEEEYSHALSYLTWAVSNEMESRQNATLSAVLLLAIFEVSLQDASTTWKKRV